MKNSRVHPFFQRKYLYLRVSVIMLFSFLSMQDLAFADNPKTDTKVRRWSLEFYYSPRVTNIIIGNESQSTGVWRTKDRYTSAVFFNAGAILSCQLKKPLKHFEIGFSYLNYGFRDHYKIIPGGSLPGGSLDNDTISAISKSGFIAIPIGFRKTFLRKKIKLEIGLGLINNFFSNTFEESVDQSYGYSNNTGSFPFSDYFMSTYLKFGLSTNSKQWDLLLQPIINYTILKMSPSFYPESVRTYQLGIDLGFRFKL